MIFFQIFHPEFGQIRSRRASIPWTSPRSAREMWRLWHLGGGKKRHGFPRVGNGWSNGPKNAVGKPWGNRTGMVGVIDVKCWSEAPSFFHWKRQNDMKWWWTNSGRLVYPISWTQLWMVMASGLIFRRWESQEIQRNCLFNYFGEKGKTASISLIIHHHITKILVDALAFGWWKNMTS